MKVQLDWKGDASAEADFALLRAALRLAQAATPTAAASDRATPAIAPREALIRLFGDRASGSEEQAALHGCFRPVSAGDADAQGGGTE